MIQTHRHSELHISQVPVFGYPLIVQEAHLQRRSRVDHDWQNKSFLCLNLEILHQATKTHEYLNVDFFYFQFFQN